MATQSKKARQTGATAPPSLLERVGKAAPSMRLDTVKMVRGSFEIVEGAAPKRESPLEVAVNCRLADKDVLVEVMLDFLDSPSFLQGLVVRITAGFKALYRFEGAEIAQDDLVLFGRINGLYNTWPYWREFAQSATLRMELPALVVPLLTAQQAAAWVAECKTVE
jgi:hypothetical protein